MELIGAGWGRTGTMSLQTALEILGFRCYHMKETCQKENLGHNELWMQAYAGLPTDLNEILCTYTATVDWPGAAFYKQLLERYPTAKVVLTVRDPAAWYKSAFNSVWEAGQIIDNAPWYVKLLDPFRLGTHRTMVNMVVWNGDVHGCFAKDPERAQKLFSEHIAEVKQVVPPERLLVYEVSQGWGPLCKFLDKPVPNQPFPHINDAKEWVTIKARLRHAVAYWTYAIPAVSVAAATAVAVGGLVLIRLQQRQRLPL